MITTHLRIAAIVGSLALLVFVVDLVRRRRLKEEYSVLWVAIALLLILLASWGGLLHGLTHAIGAITESSTLYFFGLLFVVFLLLHFSIRVSLLERRLTALVQEIALLAAQRGAPSQRPAGPTEIGEPTDIEELFERERHEPAAQHDDVMRA